MSLDDTQNKLIVIGGYGENNAQRVAESLKKLAKITADSLEELEKSFVIASRAFSGADSEICDLYQDVVFDEPLEFQQRVPKSYDQFLPKPIGKQRRRKK